MARGKDKTVELGDIKNMSPGEQTALFNAARMGRVKIEGTAVVRTADSGNVKYADPQQAGNYGEENV